jgi:hypothetical protein
LCSNEGKSRSHKVELALMLNERLGLLFEER